MNKLIKKKIRKEDFLKLNENDIYFITIPGRMGDEDSITFILKENNNYYIYKIDGLIYPSSNPKKDQITLKDIIKQFPKWNNNDKEKYQFIYMGFGNGLCIDNRIYNTYKPYLDKEVSSYLESQNTQDKESLKYAAIFNVWKDAVIKMIEKNTN